MVTFKMGDLVIEQTITCLEKIFWGKKPLIISMGSKELSKKLNLTGLLAIEGKTYIKSKLYTKNGPLL